MSNAALQYYEDDVYPTVEDIKGDLLLTGEFSYGGHNADFSQVMEMVEEEVQEYLHEAHQTKVINTKTHFALMDLIEKKVEELAINVYTAVRE